MRYCGIQPQYFPRLHYFARILASDIFLIRDEAQFVAKHKYPNGSVDKSYQAHTPIKHSFGKHLLTLPIEHSSFRPIYKTAISYNDTWVQNHLLTLKFAYAKSPNFAKIYSQIEKLLNSKFLTIATLDIATIVWGILNLLGEEKMGKSKLSLKYLNQKLKTQQLFRLKDVRLSSQSHVLKITKNLTANEKIIALCKEVGATEDYCGGTAMSAYLDEDLFRRNGITTIVQDWKCQEYPQNYIKQQGFIANLSIIDLLMNVSSVEAFELLQG